MNYTEWFIAQTPERQALSERLMNASYNLGKANREGDKEMSAKYSAEVKQIYKEIEED